MGTGYDELDNLQNQTNQLYDEQMKQQYTKEIQLLRKGLSLRNIQAITSTSINTLRKLKNMLMAS